MTISYRQTLRSSTIIGGASIINVILSLLRMKAAALFLGPAGVGLIGIFSNLVGVAISLAGLGLGNSGTRQIAAADGNTAAARRALRWMSIIMAVSGAGLFWALRGILAAHVLGDIGLADNVGWLALAVGLSIIAGSQEAMLNGLRRVGDLSRLSVYAAFWSSVLGIAALWMWGLAGVVVYIIAVPFVGVILGQWYVAKLPQNAGDVIPMSSVVEQGREMLKLGFAFMLTSTIGYSGILFVRSLVQNELGIEATGYFQAAWAISMTYIGFVLSAMGADYYPRLTAAINDHASVNRMVNEQTEVALLLAGPVLLAMMALAPWVIHLLYSQEFQPATDVLHWQILGDILKVASWPLGFIILAAGDGKTFVFSESIGIGAFVLLTWLMIPWFGLEATGISFFGMYVVYLPIVFWLVKRRTGFSLDSAVLKQIILLFVAAAVVMGLARYSQTWAAGTGLLLSAVFGVYGFSRLAHKTELSGPLGKLAAYAQTIMKKIGVWHE